MRKTSEKELAAVLQLDGPARFAHSIKRIVDGQAAWGLWQDGWALMADAAGASSFPLWPAREYAEVFRNGEWAGYEAAEISLDDLLDELLPKLRAQAMCAAVFPKPPGKGVVVDPAALEAALREELERYL